MSKDLICANGAPFRRAAVGPMAGVDPAWRPLGTACCTAGRFCMEQRAKARTVRPSAEAGYLMSRTLPQHRSA
ncbi:hypothetical protein WMO64_06385 [Pseudoflavonifractor sp. CLA-AP-H29]|uniref:Uncharacterized protein n=1 Tax=Pseudoflavonifractor intestinihominis TaxID=3133171 RepID=A0ABV1E704_9FIRM